MKKLTLLFALFSAAITTNPAHAQAPNLIANGNFAEDVKGWTYHFLGTQNPAPVFVAATPTKEIARAFHAEVKPETAEGKVLKVYSMTIGQNVSRPMKAGETFKIMFWARSPESNTLAVILETTAKPNKSIIYKRMALTPEWKQYDFEAAAKEDLPAGGAALTFHFALKPGTIELSGVEVLGEPQ